VLFVVVNIFLFVLFVATVLTANRLARQHERTSLGVVAQGAFVVLLGLGVPFALMSFLYQVCGRIEFR
jgi:hypothetical protein